MSERLRILVVQHEDDAGPALAGERLAAAGCELVLAAPAGVVAGAITIPASPDGYDGVVVLGGTPRRAFRHHRAGDGASRCAGHC